MARVQSAVTECRYGREEGYCLPSRTAVQCGEHTPLAIWIERRSGRRPSFRLTIITIIKNLPAASHDGTIRRRGLGSPTSTAGERPSGVTEVHGTKRCLTISPKDQGGSMRFSENTAFGSDFGLSASGDPFLHKGRDTGGKATRRPPIHLPSNFESLCHTPIISFF